MITHLACVMDGNRRWASQKGHMPWYGHRAGVDTIETVINFCLQYNIPYVSLYTFSLENFQRSEQERSYLFAMVIDHAQKYIPECIQKGISIKFIGDMDQFPLQVQAMCKNVQEQTAHCTTLYLNFLFGYGSRQELFAAVQRCAEQLMLGTKLTQDYFESCLWTAGIPDPDLIIRTGGVQRLSNFLLYQSAYTEIRFLDTLWPDLSETEILTAVMSAVHAQKNLGR